MKITGLRTEVVHIPFTPPIGSALHELRSADCVLVFLETDAGLVGEGLCMNLNNNRVKLIHEMVLSLEPLVVGLDAGLAGGFSVRAWRDIASIGHKGISIIGLAGVEEALWDLRAKAAGVNVARLIGACRATVPVYHSGGLWFTRTIDELQREAAGFVAQGWRGMKMRLGKPDPREDAARVRAVREAIGPDIALMADSNQRWTVTEAIRLGRLIEEYNLAWFEEPVRYYDHAGEAEIAAALVTPIASGESEYTSRGMFDMLRQKSVDILMPDLQRMGGPGEFLKAAHLAEAFDIPVVSHLYPEMNLSLLAAVPNAMTLEYMPWCEPVYAERLERDAKGDAIVPDRPGWGFSFDPAAVRRFRVG